MQNKQTLRVDKADSDDIVRIAGYYSSYIDRVFFEKEQYFGENTEDVTYKSYPVKVEALRVQWILYSTDNIDDAGQRFLHAIFKSENIDLYDITTVQILIEFLFREYRRAILKYDFPLYLLRLTSFFLLVYVDEGKFKPVQVIEKDAAGQDI